MHDMIQCERSKRFRVLCPPHPHPLHHHRACTSVLQKKKKKKKNLIQILFRFCNRIHGHSVFCFRSYVPRVCVRVRSHCCRLCAVWLRNVCYTQHVMGGHCDRGKSRRAELAHQDRLDAFTALWLSLRALTLSHFLQPALRFFSPLSPSVSAGQTVKQRWWLLLQSTRCGGRSIW